MDGLFCLVGPSIELFSEQQAAVPHGSRSVASILGIGELAPQNMGLHIGQYDCVIFIATAVPKMSF
jgi:hypothetical protein